MVQNHKNEPQVTVCSTLSTCILIVCFSVCLWSKVVNLPDGSMPHLSKHWVKEMYSFIKQILVDHRYQLSRNTSANKTDTVPGPSRNLPLAGKANIQLQFIKYLTTIVTNAEKNGVLWDWVTSGSLSDRSMGLYIVQENQYPCGQWHSWSILSNRKNMSFTIKQNCV